MSCADAFAAAAAPPHDPGPITEANQHKTSSSSHNGSAL